jgi:tetratricopeptide (TPR) repeat protein
MFSYICNIYSQNNNSLDSLKITGFARFLYDQKLYDFAAQEYERLTFLYPNEGSHLLYLFKCYRLNNQYEKIEQKAKNTDLNNEDILKEYILSLALNDQVEIATLIYKEKITVLNPKLAPRMAMDLDMIAGKYTEAELKYTSLEIKDPSYYSLILEGKKIKQKSPVLAGLLSSVMPGTGRIYSNDYKDGILSLVFIASTAYQSYRRFNSKGTKSLGGWVYGGVTLGFYIGNIYGSIKSAKNYNKKIKSSLNEKSKSYINTFYSL